jgi:hypothetical protein
MRLTSEVIPEGVRGVFLSLDDARRKRSTAPFNVHTATIYG